MTDPISIGDGEMNDMLLFDAVIRSTDLSEFTSEQLVFVLRHLDDAYFNDDELVPDRVYDAIKQYLTLSDPNNDYLQDVGSDVRGGKVDLPHPMGSLNQLYTQKDIDDWRAKHNIGDDEIILITDKLDGNSQAKYYSNTGDLRISYSRGNGFQGADSTRHMRRFKSVPQKVSIPNLEVRAEAIISKPNFKKLAAMGIKSRSTGKPYKNPRNMMSGLMNSSEMDARVLDYIDVIVYHSWTDTPVSSKLEELKLLQAQGFKVPAYVSGRAADVLKEDFLIPLLNKHREQSMYEIDGIVVEVDDKHRRDEINPSKATLNPAYSFKYKVASEDNNAIATVKYVEWNVSKHGYLKPTIVIEPVQLVGVTVQNATGFNAGFIIDSGIGPGAKIEITRSGDVIPYVLRVVEKSTYTLQDHEEDWGEFGDTAWTDTGVDVFLTSSHEEAELQKAVEFFTKIGVDGLKEGNVRKLFSTGFNTTAKIVNADIDDITFSVGSDSTGREIYESLTKCLQKLTLPLLMGASSLLGRGIGVRKVQKMYDVLGDGILTAGEAEIARLDGFNTKTAAKYIANRDRYVAFFEEIKDKIKFVEVVVNEGGNLFGQCIVMTGFRNNQLKQRFIDAGAKVVDSFTKEVTIVVAADPDGNSAKLVKARNQGKRIIGLADVEELF